MFQVEFARAAFALRWTSEQAQRTCLFSKNLPILRMNFVLRSDGRLCRLSASPGSRHYSEPATRLIRGHNGRVAEKGIYDTIGGERTCRQLAEALYARIPHDPALRH